MPEAGSGPITSGAAARTGRCWPWTARPCVCAHHEGGEQTKLVAVFDHADHLALSQVEAIGGDELTAFAALLGTVPDAREGAVTGDALHCQRTHADYLHAATPVFSAAPTSRCPP